jgi:large subunit ribosomal protein L35
MGDLELDHHVPEAGHRAAFDRARAAGDRVLAAPAVRRSEIRPCLGAAARLYATLPSLRRAESGMPVGAQRPILPQEWQMPKMKTKSSAKKRFKMTASGKVKAAQAGKRHGMIKRTNKFIRDARGTHVLSEPDTKLVKQMMPYAR